MLLSHPLWWEFARTLRIWYIFAVSWGLLLVQPNPTTAECAARYGLASTSITCSGGTYGQTQTNRACLLPPRTPAGVMESRLPSRNPVSDYVYRWKFVSTFPMTISFENADFWSWQQPHALQLFKCAESLGCGSLDFVTISQNGQLPGVFTSDYGFVVQFSTHSFWSAAWGHKVPKFDMR